MMQRAERARADRRGLLARLRQNTAGNTLAIMAAALVPLCAFAGSAMDMARLYVVKVRLQQACDAGVLAGRKFLPASTLANVNLVNASVASTNTVPSSDGKTLAADGTQALTYFNANLELSWGGSGWYTASTDKFTANTISDVNQNTQVAGSATVTVPMTLMKMFNAGDQPVSVACQASFSTPDTDVMFVLDTTGSMGCAVTRPESVNSLPTSSAASSAAASCSDPGGYAATHQASIKNADGSYTYYVTEEMSGATNVSRLDALRQAVNQFYTTVSTKKDASTNVRYGFVPFTSTVNVGTLLYGLNSGYMVNKWSYDSRTPTNDYVTSSSVASKVVTAADQNACNANAARDPTTRVNSVTGDANAGYPYSGAAKVYRPVWTAATGNGTGSGNGNSPAKCTVYTDLVGPVWTYQGGVQYDLSNYLKGGVMVDPGRVDGSTTVWNGCIEERDTTAGATSFNQSSLPPDLDPDLIPTSDNTRWRPMWADVVYRRIYYSQNGNLYYANGNKNWSASTYNDNDTRVINNYNDPSLAQNGNSSCPAQAKPLFLPADTTTGATTISSYVSGLKALGGTYLDLGIIWGTRMLSPTGIWASNNASPAGRGAPKRLIIFVTDGNMSPSSMLYGGYGVEYPDHRVTGTVFAGADPSSAANDPAYVDMHHQRLLAECAKAKSDPLNFDVWVVEVAQASTAGSATQLQQCASRPSQVLPGQTTAQLATSFQQIAAQVAMLRVSN